MRTSALALFGSICLYTSSVLAQQCPTPGPTNWCSGLYQYDGMGNIKAIGADVYHYDELGRLVDGTADVQRSGLLSRQNYTYDAFGNRTEVSRSQGSVGCVGGCEIAVSVSSATNHITSNGAQYDDAGNLWFIQSTVGSTNYPATYTYDGAGSLVRAVASDDREFIYTADDERIATKNGVTWTWMLRGLDNKVLREYMSMEVNNLPTANLTWVKDYIWRDGLLLASVAPVTPGSSTTTVQHYHLDHLGTPRVVTSAAGAVIGVHAYYPFGAELDLSPREPNTEALKFTGHERDNLPGGPLSLDYMHARFEMGTLGRFLSLDPAFSRSVFQLPQAWNRYSYVRNNPMTFIDPTGLNTTCITVKGERKDGKPGTDHVICSESIDVHSQEPTLRLSRSVGGASGNASTASLSQTLDHDRAKTGDFEDEMVRIAKMQHCFEGTIAPLVVGGGAVVAGEAVTAAGLTLTGTAFVTAGPSYGISLVLVPAGLTVTAGGGYLLATGASVYTNTFNNWFGTRIPSASGVFPNYFPQYPPRNSNPCSEH